MAKGNKMDDLRFPLRIVISVKSAGGHWHNYFYTDREWPTAHQQWFRMIQDFRRLNFQEISLGLLQGLDELILEKVHQE